FVGALQKLDGHEHHLFVAEIFQIMHLELPRPIALVPGLARSVGVFDRGAVTQVLAAAPAADRRPEIIEHMAVKSNPLAPFEADHPDANALVLGEEPIADARIGIALLPFELGSDLRRPGGVLRAFRVLVEHCQSHGVPPSLDSYIAAFSGGKCRGQANCGTCGERWWLAAR